MIKKFTLKKLQSENPIISFYLEYVKLKGLYRQGWIKSGVSLEICESVAEHSFGCALLALVISSEYRPELDSKKVAIMALIHDLGEAHVGDVFQINRQKNSEELLAVEKIFSKLKFGQKYIDLWKEFEEGKSEESIFVRQVDKIELLLQGMLYEDLSNVHLQEFFINSEKSISLPEIKNVYNEILKMRNYV
jgi:putative hydrolase of HD superfamily